MILIKPHNCPFLQDAGEKGRYAEMHKKTEAAGSEKTEAANVIQQVDIMTSPAQRQLAYATRHTTARVNTLLRKTRPEWLSHLSLA